MAAGVLLITAFLFIASAPTAAQDVPTNREAEQKEPSVLKKAPETIAVLPSVESTAETKNIFTEAATQRTLTQSVSQAIVPQHSVACGVSSSMTTENNSYWRAFNVAANSLGGFNVQSVSFGIETSDIPNNGTQPINVRLYAQTAGVFPGGTRVQIGSTATVQIATQKGTFVTVPITATVPAEATELVVEINSPGNTTAAGSQFYIGSNSDGQTGPGYISAPDCGINSPSSTADLGFPSMHIVLNVTGLDGVQVLGTKTVSGSPYAVGSAVTYTITLTNRGAADQMDNPGDEFVDVLPSSLTLVSASATSGTITSSGNTVAFNGGIAAGGSVTITINAVINADAGGQIISNQGTISYDNDMNGTNETTALTDDPTVAGTNNPTNFTATGSADISVTKTDSPDPVTAGSNLTYTITVTNNGQGTASSVSLSDTLPANTTFVSLTSPMGWSCMTPAVGSGGTVSCSIPSLSNGASAQFTLVVNVPTCTSGGTVLSNTATVSSSTSDSNAGNNSATSMTTVTGETTPPVINPNSYQNITVELPPNSNATSAVVNYPQPTATDNCGAVTVTTNPPSGSTFPVGTTTVTITATDDSGNQSTASFTVSVRYRFSMVYYSDLLLNEQTINQVSAGSNVPIRFSLSGYKGANPYSQPPTSQQINCSTLAPIGMATTINRFSPDPYYSSLYDFYQTTWQTQANWKFTCRRLTLYLNDGTTRSLDFYFK